MYERPEAFEPERFLEPRGEMEPGESGAWGYGRRICAGRAFAEESLWMNVVGTLAVFEIVGEGEVVRPGIGLLCKVPEFKCSVRPRSERCVELLRRVEKEVEGIET